MELTQLEKLLEVATKYGVRRLRTSEIEIELSAISPMASSVEQPATPSVEISDEDMLFWSVNGQAPNLTPSK